MFVSASKYDTVLVGYIDIFITIIEFLYDIYLLEKVELYVCDFYQTASTSSSNTTAWRILVPEQYTTSFPGSLSSGKLVLLDCGQGVSVRREDKTRMHVLVLFRSITLKKP